ncbi:helix-turn-helix transcriptional regulator [Cognatishimia maritima]|uniref:AraC family transcriptional regulator, transcriptional activator of pobA n=1 Tax=Cognatishimia maritima TaxID=870908 RepID=A0A1M5I442_9RHOB|nr:AraC family transcriptional regulator [Cognatishimia maritima]SHG23094.1 AraC family transcriptional regulator, transcriptional activator of pobA [Cognatishimia maritima]
MCAVTVQTFAQFGQYEPWRHSLVHVQRGGLLLWVTRGQGVLHMHGVRRGFGTNNAVYIPPDHLWAVDFGRQTLGLAVALPRDLSDHFPKTERLLRVQDALAQSELTGLIEDMRREQQQDRPFVGEALAAQSALIGIWLRRQIEALPPQTKPRAAERLARRYATEVARSLGTGINMAEIAAQLEVSPAHLTRVCRDTAGMTASEIQTQPLLHEARKLLVDTKTPVKAIAAQLGFNSAAYFTRFIQHHCGQSPRQLRQAAQHTAKPALSRRG